MASLELARRRLQAVGRLKVVTRTMRLLAAANIRQCERAAAALADYEATIELGLQVLLQSPGRPRWRARGHAADSGPAVLVVLGSDQGMCGRFNEDVVERVCGLCGAAEAGPFEIVAVGQRGAERLAARGVRVASVLRQPGSTSGLPGLVEELLTRTEVCRDEAGAERLLIAYNRRGALRSAPAVRQLLPADAAWLRGLQQRRWPTRVIPMAGQKWPRLFGTLLRQATWVALFRAAAESQAAENFSRLQAMQAAEKHVGEHLEELERAYWRQRQDAITEEVMDVVVGSEAQRADGGDDGR